MFQVTRGTITHILRKAKHPVYERRQLERVAAEEAIQKATRLIQEARVYEAVTYAPSRYEEKPLRYPEPQEAKPAIKAPPPGFIDWFAR